MVGFLLAAAIAVGPSGWTAERPALTFGMEEQTFRAPGDPDTTYTITQGNTASAPSFAALAAPYEAGATVTRRDHRPLEAQTIDELEVANADGTRTYLRLTHGSTGEGWAMRFGVCHGRGAAFAACEQTLGRLYLQEVGSVDTAFLDSMLATIAIVALAIGFLAAMIWYAATWLVRRRDLGRSSPLVDGEVVSVAGLVQPLAPVIDAPLSGRPCLVHRSRTRVYGSGTDAEAVEHEVVPFCVKTRRGEIRIDERALEILAVPEMVVDTAGPRLLAFRARHGIAAGASAGFDEILVEPGAKVLLRGVVRVERDTTSVTERGYRDDLPMVARLVATPEHPVTIVRIW